MKVFDLFRKKLDKSKYKKGKGVRLGLALGGGATRGIALIGVFRAFEELGIEFDAIAGTSVGSLFGALYADGWTSDEMEKMLSVISEKDIRSSKFFFMPSDTRTFYETIIKMFGSDKSFGELKKKFIAVSVNLKSGNEVDITSGSVARAITASSAVPGVFKPVVWDDKNLVDGGLVNSVPCDVARKMGVDFVVGVDVNRTRGDGTDSLKTLGILGSVVGIMLKSNATQNLHHADYIICPDLKRFKNTKFDGSEEMIEEGYQAVMQNKEELIKILNGKPKKREELWQTPHIVEKI